MGFKPAPFLEGDIATLNSEDINFTPAYKERLKAALSVLKITWSNEDEEDEEYEDDEDELLHTPSNN